MATQASALVGRDHELDRLTGHLTSAASSVVLLSGPAGSGKSVLLDAVRTGWTEPSRWARGVSWERDVAGGVLRQLLRLEDVPREPVEAAGILTAALPAGPSLLLVDDADQADLLSLRALSSATRHGRPDGLHVVLAARTVTAALREVAVDEVPLSGLDAVAVAALAAQHGRTLQPGDAAVLRRHTDGNPRDVIALLTELPPGDWSRPGLDLPAPAATVAEVRERLDATGPEARALVEAVAILAGPAAEGVDRSEAVALAGRGPAGLTDVFAALDAAVATGLVTPSRAPRPVSPLLRAAVVGSMGEASAAAAHRQAAEVVDDPVRSLRHRVAASPGPDAGLADELDDVARARGAEGAWLEAAALLLEASRLTVDRITREDRLTRSVDARIAAGDCVGAAAVIPTIEGLRETPMRNAVLAYLAIVRGRAAEAEARLHRAWSIVNSDRDPETAGLIAQRYVLHSLAHCRGPELVAWADRSISLAGRASSAGVEAAAIRGLGVAASGEPAAATLTYQSLAERVHRGPQAQRVALGRGWLLLVEDQVDEARSSLESAATMPLGGSVRIGLWAHGWLARLQFLVGEWDEALSTVDRGLALASDSGIVLATPLLLWTSAQVEALRGHGAAAATAVRSAEVMSLGYEIMAVPSALARAQLAEAETEHAGVLRALEPLTRHPAGTNLDEPGFWPWVDLYANALVAKGRPDEADAFLRPREECARERGHRSTLARLGSARGRLSGAAGDLDTARSCFEEALDLLDGLPLRYDRARVSLAYGQTLRRAGRRRDADALITQARELYAGLGAVIYVQRCDRELKAGGLHAPRGGRDHVELTPQEEAVTALVAQGMSNREVAAELFLSPKTVQFHLTRIYAKLGVRSRSELAALQR